MKILALLYLLPAVSLLAGDWPQFRGPNRDGVWAEAGIMQTFPPEGLTVRWRAPVGAGLSSPVISDGRVYVCDSERKNPRAWERVHCLDEKTGRQLWIHSHEVTYPAYAFDDPKNPTGPDSTPLASGGKVYAYGRDANLVCLDARDGTVLWQRDLTKDYGLGELAGSATSPVIEGQLIILVIGGKPDAGVIALDKDTGQEAWRALGDRWSYSSPIVINAGGQRQLIAFTPESVTSLDPATGKTWWRQPSTTRTHYTASCSVFQDELLFAGGMMFRLHPDQPESTLLWPEARTTDSRRILSQTSSPLLRDGFLFSDKTEGHLVCLEALTGKQVWQYDDLGDHKLGAAQQLFPNGDSTLVFTTAGDLIRVHLGAEGCRELSRVHLIDPTIPYGGRDIAWPLPAFAHGHVFARNDRELICVSLEAKP